MTEAVCRVVIIDDSPEDRAELRRLLLAGSERRYRFVEATTGMAGLRVCLESGEWPPDCVFLDYHLPDYDAPEVLAALGGYEHPYCPVVVITGSTGGVSGPTMLRAGAQDFVGKTWMNPESLTRAVENAIERFAMAREIRASEARLRLGTEVAGFAVAEVDYPTLDVRLTPEAARLLGLDQRTASISQQRMLDLSHPDDLPEILAQTEAALDPKGKGWFAMEYRIVTPAGEVRWLSVRKQVFFRAYPDGSRPELAILAMTDISERKRTEQAVRESEARFRAMADAAPVLIWVAGVDRQCEWFNQRWLEFTGRPMASELGQGWTDRVHPEDLDHCLAAYVGGFERHEPFETEYRLLRADGAYRWVFGRGVPRFDSEGGFLGYIGSCVDVTERKAAEAKLQEQAEQLREADRRKDEFLAMLAHELRNPLAPIRNAVHILRRVGGDAPQLAWCRDLIERQIEHLARLVDDLLDVSRITRGRIELKQEALSLADIVHRAVETSRPLIDARQHRFAVRLPQEPVRVQGDLIRLAQVISNLLNNAAKYTDPGGRIDLNADATDSDVFIRVRDTGQGIDPYALSRLFDLFYQVDYTLDRSEGGLGIGLSLVKRLVEMHGGSVYAYSEGRGRGSEFVVRLARLPDAPACPSAPVAALPARDGLRVLVVDDDHDSVESMALLLGFDGHEVRTAHDGREAVRIALAWRPDVVLLDIGLPGWNGYEACRQMREGGLAETLMVAMTGYGQDEDRRLAREAGFDAHQIKPVDALAIQELLAARRPAD